MKLYNLYKDIILEASQAQISKIIDSVIAGGVAKNGKPYNNWVNIWYKKDRNKPARKMFVLIMGRGKLQKGTNKDAIRVWDPGYGGTKRQRMHKTLLTDKIVDIEVKNLRQFRSDEFQSYAKNKINPPNDKSFQGGRYEKSVKI
jgi:hypothetical protein